MATKQPPIPQQARSIATRAALLDAAIDCLVTEGYASVTTTDIAERAGVSRGAQLHHFPSKSVLLATALEHLLQQRLQEARAIAKATPRTLTAAEVVLATWKLFQGSTFIAYIELWIAARTDPELAALVADTENRFTEETRMLFVEHFGLTTGVDPARLEMFRDFAFAVISAVTLQRLVPRGQRPASDYLDVLIELGNTMLSTSVVDDAAH